MTEKNQPLQHISSTEPLVGTMDARFSVPGWLRPGDLCPRCGEEKLDYDGTLSLVCPRCGLVQGGCFS